MNHKPLFMIREEENGPEWLGDESDAKWAEFSRPTNKASEITVEAMANMLDQDAESRNAHEFVNCHRGLAIILGKHLSRHKATKIFRDLIDLGGLQGIDGVCGAGDKTTSESFLGVPRDRDAEWGFDQ